MSEPPPTSAKTEDSVDYSPLNGDGDATHPAEDILNVLNQLNSDTAPNSQESIDNEQPKQEQEVQQPKPFISEWQLLRDRLHESPHDPEGWNRLVELAENSGNINEIKETYETLLETYPNTVCQLPVFRRSQQFSDYVVLLDLSHPPRLPISTII